MFFILIAMLIIFTVIISLNFFILPLVWTNFWIVKNLNINKTDIKQQITINDDMEDKIIKKTSKLLDDNINIDDYFNNNFGTKTDIQILETKNNNYITNNLVNQKSFNIEFKLLPLEDLPEIKLYFNGNVKDIIYIMYDLPLDKNINWTYQNLLNLKSKLYKFSKNYCVLYWNLTSVNLCSNNWFIRINEVNFIDPYYKQKFKYELTLMPLYNVDVDDNWNFIIKYKNINQIKPGDFIFKKWHIYFIQLFFIFDNNTEPFKLYIPNGWFLTLNNLNIVLKNFQNYKYNIIHLKKISKSFLDKINNNIYGF